MPTATVVEQYSFPNSTIISLQFDSVSTIGGNYFVSGSSINTIVIRTPTMCALTSALNAGNYVLGGTGKIYVPYALISNYSTATNWVTNYNRGQIKAINQDATCSTGDTFTPTTTATGVDHWDVIALQSYTTYSAFDSSTGAVTTSHDGRLLIRGRDANDEILHVTYLQIGTGFDEAQNLLENL